MEERVRRASVERAGDPGAAPQALLERDSELAVLGDSLDAACRGDGSVVTLLGEPGIGKTSLLKALGAIATRRGALVRTARGTQVEQDYPFGIARHLFERPLADAAAPARAALLAGPASLAEGLLSDVPTSAVGGNPFAAIHALYWLAENLARESPAVLLVVDDVQWADPPSLRFLAYLANRLDGVPMLVALAALASEVVPENALLHDILGANGTRVLNPAPLSAAGTAALVERSLKTAPDSGFSAACQLATGGNPYLVNELAAELLSNRVQPTDANASRVSDLGPESVGRRVCARLAQLGDAHIAFGRALSVLGPGAAIADAAALAGLDETDAARAADDLARAGLVPETRPLDFQHPLVGRAIYRDIPPLARSELHARAARLLADRGARSSAVTSQLLETEPRGDPWVVEHLRGEASSAVSRGAPSVATRALRRALAEPPPEEAHAAVLLELGVAAARAGDADALERMREAWALARDAPLHARAALELATALALSGQVEEAVAVVEQELATLDHAEPDLAMPLESLLPMLALSSRGARSLAAGRLEEVEADTGSLPAPLAGAVLSALALERAISGGSAEEAARLAERALAEGRLLDEHGSEAVSLYFAAAALIGTDRADRADQVLTIAMEDARRYSSAQGAALASAVRAYARTRTGDLPGAEEDALAFQEQGPEVRSLWLLPSTLAVSSLALVQLERCDQGTAEPALELELERLKRVPDDQQVAILTPVHDALARLLMMRGEPGAALREFSHCGRLHHADTSAPNGTGEAPAVVRARAAVATAALGRADEARALADDAIQAARSFGAPRSVGVALQAAAVVASEESDRASLLEEAVATLEGSCDRLEHARALVELGAARRRLGRRAAAREPLREGQELAHACGATALRDHAYTELRATGARARRMARSGLDELTPSERRVAGMAANGMSNREIAQGLFVTVKTVEVHLTHTYAKLGIGSRRELAAALTGGPAGSDR